MNIITKKCTHKCTKNTNEQIGLFVEQLGRRPHSVTVFNPYRDAVLADNLRIYLRAMTKVMGARPAMLIGEAPGYLGCRLTGIPFSSGELFVNANHYFLKKIATKLKITEIAGEASATMVWQCLERRRNLPLFWNSFPFHPHRSGNARSNRSPTAEEVREGRSYLEALIDIYQPQRVAAIGRAAGRALQAVYPDHKVTYIRHPSYGGKADFVKGMEQFFKR